jgi:DNA-binding CsgD family transcriptional regulator
MLISSWLLVAPRTHHSARRAGARLEHLRRCAPSHNVLVPADAADKGTTSRTLPSAIRAADRVGFGERLLAPAMSHLATIAAARGSAHRAFPYTCSVAFWQCWRMSAGVVGRPGEVEAIERFLDALADGSGVLLLEGEPGIGKTTLLRAGVEAARRRGVRVLWCAASPAEARLSYAALADLLGGVEGEVLERLPAPQREALDAALLRSAPGAGGVDRRAVASAVLSVLEGLAGQGAVVAAIDDLQWVDRPSARVLEFCARRLRRGVGLLASQRLGEERAWSVGLLRPREPSRIEVRVIPPLRPGALARLLRERADRPLGRRALARVEQASGGNPFYALELARALPAGGPPLAALLLPASLDEVVATRLAGLGRDVEQVLLAIAALSEPTLELLERALGPGAARLVEAAEERGVVALEGGHVHFTHPLLANGAYARATAGRRREMHRRLSGVVADVEERARHLAYAGMPDAVAALGEAARHVRARGAPDAAAELLELALGLGGDEELRLRAAEHHYDAGEPRRAQALLEHAIEALPAGEARAEALLRLGELRYHDDSFREARELLERAQSQAGDNERLQLMIELRLTFTLFNIGPPPAALAPGRSALARAERLGDPALLAQALACSVMVEFCLGLGLDEKRLRRALELGDPDDAMGAEFQPALIASFLFLWTARLEESRAVLLAGCERWRDRGAEHWLAWASHPRVWLECWCGDLASATTAMTDSVERLLQLETSNGQALALTSRAQVAAYAGRADEAHRDAEEALALFERAGWTYAVVWPLMTLGFLALSKRDYEAAAATVGPAAAMAAATRMPEPAALGGLLYGDAAEALVAVGRSGEAEAIVSWLEERGAALDRTWAIAVGARCRGLLLAAEGDVARAERVLERALAAHEGLPIPIERARSLLVLGRIRRRLRKRLAAKAALEEARAVFEAVGSPLWAAQASAEIAGLGLRPRSSDTLTTAEERVARLAATGLTNQQVAATLLVSPKTVEAHLARAYRKLGIHSRAELGAHMAQHQQPARE